MPGTQRRRHPSVIQQLLDAPQRFECFQALRLLLAWLAEHGIDEHTALAKILRFDNSVSLRFPASQIEALATNGIADADALLQALLSGHLQHIHLTPAFMGLLGCQGSLPSHYSERIAAHQHSERDTSARAFLDLFSSRAVALFYQAWQKYRIEQAGHSGAFLSRLLDLAACQPGQGQDQAAIGLYSGLLQQRNISSIVMARILGDHFGVPCHIDEATGAMDALAPREQTALGMANAVLGQRATIGERCRRPDLAVRLRLGPLTAQQHASFLPRAPASQALRQMLMLFGQPLVRYEIVLVLHASEVRGLALTMRATRRTRLQQFPRQRRHTAPPRRHALRNAIDALVQRLNLAAAQNACVRYCYSPSTNPTVKRCAMSQFPDTTAAWTALTGDMQGQRLLRLHFPHGDGPTGIQLLANSLAASESLSRDFSHVVEVLSDDAAIALDKMMGKMVTIELVREDGTLRYFNGYVFEFRFLRTDGGFAFYKMVLEPWLAHLHLRQNNVAFHGLTVAALTDKVFDDYLMRDYKLAASGLDPAITYTCQHNESDHNLLHRHWEQLGWHYRYEHRLDGHTLWLDDDSTTGKPIDGESNAMPFQHQAGSLEDDGVHQWSTVRRMAPAQMTVASFNFKNPRSARASRDSLNRQGAVPSLEVYENTGSYGFKNLDDGEALAQRRMEERDAQGQLFEAQGNDRTAQPGRWFTLDGHFDSAAGEYLILSVHHYASNNYQQGHGATSHYSNTFTCIPRATPWRPGRNFHSREPKIYGVQTATVVGPPGEEIHTDGYGRVKVQFHWDRLGTFDDKSSPWIRVISNWAGPNFGHISLPRVGMEVAVQFLDGNVAMPIIIGCVYNARNMPPWELPANKTQSGMLSRSSKKGSAAHANALRFEDRKDAEELWLHAEKDQRIEVEHDESHWVGNDRRKTIDRDETVHVKRDRTETVDHDEDITVHNNRRERVDHDEHIDIGDNRREHVGGNEQVQIDGHRSERVTLAKDETIGLAKVLTIGAAYQTTVIGAMNTTVVLAQAEQVGLTKSVIVGADSTLTATDSHTMTVGTSSITITPGRIELVADEIIIRGRSKVQIHGDDIDNNPG